MAKIDHNSIPSKKNPRKPSPVKQKSRRDSHNSRPDLAPPPVMARGYNLDVSYQANKIYPKARRRFNVPLRTPGAEINLPSIPVFRFSMKWLLLAMAIFLVAAIYFIYRAPAFKVDVAQVSGLVRVFKEDVNAILDIQNKPIFSIRPGELEKKLLLAFPEFSTVQVAIKMPNQVTVTVTERVPVMTWRQGDSIQFVDEQGFAFPFRLGATEIITPVVEASSSPPVISISPQEINALVNTSFTLSGMPGTETIDDQKTSEENAINDPYTLRPFLTSHMVSAILAINSQLPPNATLIYDANHGLGWLDQGGWEVFLGDDQEMPMKLVMYQSILGYLSLQGETAELISVEHLHNPYIRLREESETEQ